MALLPQCDMDKQWIHDELDRRGIPHKDLAAHLKVNQSQLSRMINPKGKRRLRDDEARGIGAFFAKSEDRHAPMHGPSTVQSPSEPFRMALVTDRSQGVPVHPTGLGGTTAGVDFTMDVGEVALTVRRPAKFIDRTDIYGLYVRGNSMAPRYNSGELILLERNKPPEDQEFVVVHLKPDDSGLQGSYIRQLVSWTDKVVRVRQLNPDRTHDIPNADVASVVRILTVRDLVE